MELLSGGLVGHLGPEEAGEFTGDSDGHDRGAFAVLGEVAVSLKEADLRLPGPVAGLWAGGGAPGGVAGEIGMLARCLAVLFQHPLSRTRREPFSSPGFPATVP